MERLNLDHPDDSYSYIMKDGVIRSCLAYIKVHGPDM